MRGISLSPGETAITASTADGKGRSAKIKILVPELIDISLSDVDEIHVGETVGLTATTYDESDASDTDDFPVTWSSSNASVLSIEKTKRTKDGDYKVYLKGNKTGKSTITASTGDGSKATVEIKVIRPNPEKIKIDQFSPILLKPGKKVNLSATVFPKEAAAKIAWESYDTSVAQVNSKGTVTAVSGGSASIWVEADDNCVDYLTVYVCKNPLHVKKTKSNMGKSSKYDLKSLLDTDALNSVWYWESSDTGVVTVSDTGVVTAWKTGKAAVVIRAFDENLNIRYALIKITVKPAPSKVTLYKGGKKLKSGASLTLKKGKSLQLKAKLPSGTLSTLTWKSDDSKVAKVNKNGKVSALTKGTAIITVKTANGKKATVKIRVK